MSAIFFIYFKWDIKRKRKNYVNFVKRIKPLVGSMVKGFVIFAGGKLREG